MLDGSRPSRAQVTRKDLTTEDSLWVALRAALGVLWPHLLYVCAFLAAAAAFIFKAVTQDYRCAEGQGLQQGSVHEIWTLKLAWCCGHHLCHAVQCKQHLVSHSLPPPHSSPHSAADIVAFIGSLGWALLVLLCLYPPLLTLLPRDETAQGWRVAWHPFTHTPADNSSSGTSAAGAGLEAGSSGLRGLLRGMTRGVSMALDHLGLTSKLSGSGSGAVPAGAANNRVAPEGAATAEGGVAAAGSSPAPAGGFDPAAPPSGAGVQQPAEPPAQRAVIGRVGLPHLREARLQQAALLTSMVLPAQHSVMERVTSVMLDTLGHAAPAGPTGTAERARSLDLSGLLAAASPNGSPATPRAGVWIAAVSRFEALNGSSAGTAAVQIGQPEQLAAVGEEGSEQEAAAVEQTVAAAPAAEAASAQDAGLIPAHPGAYSISHTAAAGSADRDGGSSVSSPFAHLASFRFSSTSSQDEGSLVVELAAEAATDAAAAAASAGPAAVPPGLADPTPQAAQAAASLAEAAAALAGGAAGGGLERVETMVVPVAPASLFEHTLLARPSFDHR